jgi:hypothetical protein
VLATAALAAVAVAAVADGVRRDDDPAPAATTEQEPSTTAAATALRQLGARGELVLSGEHCGEERLTLPSLERRHSDVCRQPGVESPDGGARALRPDGTITAAYGDEVVAFERCRAQRRCAEKLIARAELERAARRHPTVPERPARLRALVDGIAWLSDTRAAVSMSIRLGGRFEGLGPLGAIAFFDDGRLERTPPYYRLTGGRLASSPRGSYVTQTPDVILRGDGSQLSLPQHLRNVQDFAWSPDERLLALATPFAVEVVDVGSLERYDRTGGGLRSVTLPRSAAHLAWR